VLPLIDALRKHLDNFDAQIEVLRTYYAWAAVKVQSKQSTRFSGHSYTDKKKRAYVDELANQLSGELRSANLAGPIGVTLLYSFPWNKEDRNKEIEWALMTSRPDIDNLMKPVLDALQMKLAFDDGRVCQVKARKIRLLFPAVAVRLDVVREKRFVETA